MVEAVTPHNEPEFVFYTKCAVPAASTVWADANKRDMCVQPTILKWILGTPAVKT